ncbi:MAG: hypothetical protein D3M94_03485 [Rhodocyclales bacterium GT-UBC]|nr:MAG: hypothetical protein D3M94_03485 [Rhodocyclales bacterium GT-UBC]
MRYCLLLLFCCSLSIAQALEVRVALSLPEGPGQVQPTVGRVAKGGLAAFNEELAREICRRLNARCTVSRMPFSEILSSVEENRFDLGFGNYLRTPERERRVDFSEPIWRSSSRLVATPATIRRFASGNGAGISLDKLRQARVACIEGTLQHAFLRSIAPAQDLELVTVASVSETLNVLRENKADFVLQPVLSSFALIGREAPGSFEYVGPPLTENGLGGTVHVAMPKGSDALRRSVNLAIAAIRADGTFHRIVRRYFPMNLD